MKKKTPLIDGALSKIGSDFIAEKQNIGYSYYSNAYIVRDFSRYVEKHKQFAVADSMVSKAMVENWLLSHENNAPGSICNLVKVIRQLAIFMNRNGMQAYVLPTAYAPKQSFGFTAYIFSQKQLSLIFSAADNITPTTISPLRHLTMPLLFRTIYACGLRSSEATGLRIRDVDLQNGIIHINNSKFNKSRDIPIAESLCIRCEEYSKMVHKKSSADDFFFPNAYRDEYLTSTVYNVFRELLYICNIPRVNHGPRVHDLRHTYAVHVLKQWSLENKDLTSALPLLCTYMGHADLSGTQKYLQLTADLYPHIVNRLEDFYTNQEIKGGVYNER